MKYTLNNIGVFYKANPSNQQYEKINKLLYLRTTLLRFSQNVNKYKFSAVILA